MTGAKENFRDFARQNFAYNGRIDDYAQYAPIAAVYSLHAMGIKGENNFGNLTAIFVKSFLLNGIITDRLKYALDEPRPNGGTRSFPSGHTSKAFTLAHIMHKEYGEKSRWYSAGAYSCAAAVGLLRVAKDAHWISDVLSGAGIGILSTELIYLTHQYKWDNEHIKRLDIFPFHSGKQKGICLVYTF
jgi:membrane-associated phospholipid phosphatase